MQQPKCCVELRRRGFRFETRPTINAVIVIEENGWEELAVEVCVLGKTPEEQNELCQRICDLLNG